MTDLFMTAMPSAPPGAGLDGRASATVSDGVSDRAAGAAPDGGFVALLATLRSSHHAGEAGSEGEPSDDEIAAALAELAALGAQERSADWPMPALLARFIDPAVPAVLDGAAVPAAVASVAPATGDVAAPATGDVVAPEAVLSAPPDAGTGPIIGLGVDRMRRPEGETPAEPPSAARTAAPTVAADARPGPATAAPHGSGPPGEPAMDEAVPDAGEGATPTAADTTSTTDTTDTPDTTAAPDEVSLASSARPAADRAHGVDGLHSTETAPSGPATQDVDAAPASRDRSFTSSAASIQRVLDAVEHLENAPPPRQLTLEMGDQRLRISLEDGQVRLALLGQEDESGTRLLEDARAELESRGFDLGGGRREDGSPHQSPEGGDTATGTIPFRPAARNASAGLRL